MRTNLNGPVEVVGLENNGMVVELRFTDGTTCKAEPLSWLTDLRERAGNEGRIGPVMALELCELGAVVSAASGYATAWSKEADTEYRAWRGQAYKEAIGGELGGKKITNDGINAVIEADPKFRVHKAAIAKADGAKETLVGLSRKLAGILSSISATPTEDGGAAGEAAEQPAAGETAPAPTYGGGTSSDW